MTLAPFPYMGGKSRIAEEVWRRLGDPPNFVDPFFGSGAVLLARPDWDWSQGKWRDGQTRVETVNDADGLLCNVWRALKADPEQVAHYAEWPVSECDLLARHIWLVGKRESITERLEGDPEWYDAKAAGWWVWGICCWIGSGWCSGKGPWSAEQGKLVHLGDAGRGVHRQLVHLGDAGRGVHRKRVHLTTGQGVHRKLVHLGDAGRGVHRKLVHLGDAGLVDWFEALAARLRHARVCCGDWRRVLGPSPTTKQGLTAVFLDPPYRFTDRDDDLYAVDTDVWDAVRDWAMLHGDDPKLRIALCGYAGGVTLPADWEQVNWSAQGGYGSQGDGPARENRHRESVWFSRHALRPEQPRQLGLWQED